MTSPRLTDNQVMYLAGIKWNIGQGFSWYVPLNRTERSLARRDFVDTIKEDSHSSALGEFTFVMTPKGEAFLSSLSPEVIIDKVVEKCGDLWQVQMDFFPLGKVKGMVVAAVAYAIGYLPLERLPEFLASRNSIFRVAAHRRLEKKNGQATFN